MERVRHQFIIDRSVRRHQRLGDHLPPKTRPTPPGSRGPRNRSVSISSISSRSTSFCTSCSGDFGPCRAHRRPCPKFHSFRNHGYSERYHTAILDWKIPGDFGMAFARKGIKSANVSGDLEIRMGCIGLVGFALLTAGGIIAIGGMTVETCTMGAADSLGAGYLVAIFYLAGGVCMGLSSVPRYAFCCLFQPHYCSVAQFVRNPFAYGYWCRSIQLARS